MSESQEQKKAKKAEYNKRYYDKIKKLRSLNAVEKEQNNEQGPFFFDKMKETMLMTSISLIPIVAKQIVTHIIKRMETKQELQTQSLQLQTAQTSQIECTENAPPGSTNIQEAMNSLYC